MEVDVEVLSSVDAVVEKPCKELSPDSKCPICLDRFRNLSYANTCFHRFCFLCILEWSKNKAECPLCKQSFSAIYHSVRAEDDFLRYQLPLSKDHSFGTVDGQRFRYRTTLTGQSHEEARRHGDSQSHARTPQQEMIRFRQWLYRHGFRVRGVRDGGRSRDTTAEFFRKNPACLHRLVPWLKRELVVLYGPRDSIADIVLRKVLSIIKWHDIQNETVRRNLQPFLRSRTAHFLHEFLSFARSPFDMETYDRNALYDAPAPSPREFVSEDVEYLSATPFPWDDETPGPSYSVAARDVVTLAISDTDSDSEETVDTNANSAVPGEIESSDEDCVIVGFIKPTVDRTPELIQLSSSSDSDSPSEPSTSKHTAHRRLIHQSLANASIQVSHYHRSANNDASSCLLPQTRHRPTHHAKSPPPLWFQSRTAYERLKSRSHSRSCSRPRSCSNARLSSFDHGSDYRSHKHDSSRTRSDSYRRSRTRSNSRRCYRIKADLHRRSRTSLNSRRHSRSRSNLHRRSRNRSNSHRRCRTKSDSRRRSRTSSNSRRCSRARSDLRRRSSSRSHSRRRSRTRSDLRRCSRSRSNSRRRSRTRSDLRRRSRSRSNLRRRSRTRSDLRRRSRSRSNSRRQSRTRPNLRRRSRSRSNSRRRSRTRSDLRRRSSSRSHSRRRSRSRSHSHVCTRLQSFSYACSHSHTMQSNDQSWFPLENCSVNQTFSERKKYRSKHCESQYSASVMKKSRESRRKKSSRRRSYSGEMNDACKKRHKKKKKKHHKKSKKSRRSKDKSSTGQMNSAQEWTVIIEPSHNAPSDIVSNTVTPSDTAPADTTPLDSTFSNTPHQKVTP